MTKITIPRSPDSIIRIPAKTEQPVQAEAIERIGVSVKIAAEMLGVSDRTVWNLAKKGKIHTVRIGTRVIFSVQSLRDFVNGKTESADESDIACVAEGKERI
jgi:excisionase family DNA binding protein